MILFSLFNVHLHDFISYPEIHICANQTTLICGKSGSGKSTLFKLLNASLSPTSGDILYKDKSISSYDTIALRREILFVSQNVFLFDDTIFNNFKKFYHYRELPAPTEETILSYLHLCLADFSLDTNCKEMSGGERQRVFIAICLSFMPKVLLLDEPTSALDEQTANILLQNIKNYSTQNSITLLLVSHDKVLAKKYADQIISLDEEISYE